MTALWLLFALMWADPQQSSPLPEDQLTWQQRASQEYEHYRQAAIQMNELAGHIHSEVDALKFVDAIADSFAEHLPPAWTTRSIRQRVAHAEYEAVSDPLRLIPEQRIADVWNEYVREVGAPDEAIVNAAEIHSMRDGTYATGQMMWARGTNQTIWTMPNIYAVGSDGRIADGCRAVEVLRILYDIDNLFDNVRSARERLHKGISASVEIQKRLENTNSSQKLAPRLERRVRVDTNPLRAAEYRYMRERGVDNFNQVLERLFNELFAASEQAGSEAP